MRRRRKRGFTPTDTLAKIGRASAIIVLVLAFLMIASALIKATQRPTVYMVHGDQDTCVKAEDAQGKSISCEEALRGGYHTEWIAPKTLNEN